MTTHSPPTAPRDPATLSEALSLLAEERHLRKLQNLTVRDLRLEVGDLRAQLSKESEEHARTKEIADHWWQHEQRTRPVLIAAEQHIYATDPEHDSPTLRALREAILKSRAASL